MKSDLTSRKFLLAAGATGLFVATGNVPAATTVVLAYLGVNTVEGALGKK